MLWWQNLPFFSIMLCIFSAAVCSVLPRRAARVWAPAVMGIILVMSVLLTAQVRSCGNSFVFTMGHFPAPWGNEIRAGLLEAVAACVFFAIMLLSVIAGGEHLSEDIMPDKQNLYCVTLCLAGAALLVMIYTNDLFTAYVFLEIMTLGACSLIMAQSRGRTLLAATRYMILNLLGSGLFLMGLVLMYGITGHLLMEPLREYIDTVLLKDGLSAPFCMSVALMSTGLAVKSGLFPFHTWLPDSYTYGTPSSAAILSSLVCKGYIFLLIKIFLRVIGMETVRRTGICNVLFVLGAGGILMGSLTAIQQKDIRRMISFSSVAQIGYIYMGIGLGSELGMIGAIFQIFAHGIAKSMLFLSAAGLSRVSGGSGLFHDLRGAGYRCPAAGAAFTVGAFSMTGIPFFGGFIVKVLLSEAAMLAGTFRMTAALLLLAVSAVLNTLYFLKTVITLYRAQDEPAAQGAHVSSAFKWGMCCFIALNMTLGIFSQPVVTAIRMGLSMFD